MLPTSRSANGFLPWTSCCGEHLVNAHSLNPVPEMAPVNSVTVPNQISRHNIFGECFDDLLRGPFCRGMLRHIEMQHTATLMCQDHEHKEDSQRSEERRVGKEC